MKLPKWLLGAATTASAVWLIAFLLRFLFLNRAANGLVDGAFTLLNAVLLLLYYRDARSNSRVPDDMRHGWTIIVFLGAGVGQLIYFIRFVVPRPSQDGTGSE